MRRGQEGVTFALPDAVAFEIELTEKVTKQRTQREFEIEIEWTQELTGKPHQVMYYPIKLCDREQAEAVKRDLEAAFPGVDVSLMSEIAESLSDFRVMHQLNAQVSILALLIGGLGMLKTMLVSVLD